MTSITLIVDNDDSSDPLVRAVTALAAGFDVDLAVGYSTSGAASTRSTTATPPGRPLATKAAKKATKAASKKAAGGVDLDKDDYTEDELDALSTDDLRALVDAWQIELEGARFGRAKAITAVLAAQDELNS